MQTNEVDKADAFVTTDPDVMGGAKVFAGICRDAKFPPTNF